MSRLGIVVEPRSGIRNLIPKGRELAPEVFRARHRAVLIILGAHVVGLTGFAIARGYNVLHSMEEGSVVAALTVLAAIVPGVRARSVLAAVGLVTSSAILVHLSGGTIEAHFHFFVVLGLMTLYQDWAPYGVAFAYVVLHHGVFGVLQPNTVYDHPAAQANPWGWAAIHGTFVLAAALVQIFSWRTNEREHERAEAFRLEAQAAQIRRRQALEFNDDVVQGLVVAKLALNLGDRGRSEKALTAALENARGIIAGLLGDGEGGGVEPGSLVRERPAATA